MCDEKMYFGQTSVFSRSARRQLIIRVVSEQELAGRNSNQAKHLITNVHEVLLFLLQCKANVSYEENEKNSQRIISEDLWNRWFFIQYFSPRSYLFTEISVA